MNKTPWEEIGTDVSKADDLADAMIKANVMFNVSIRQGAFLVPAATEKAKPLYHTTKGYFYVVRDDINAVLGSCKSKFQPLQNAEAFAFFNPLIEDGTCRIDTIGSFGLGQKVWILAEVLHSRNQVVEGDDLSLYLLLINAHDGSSSVKIGFVSIRIWCSNMFSMCDFQLVKFKHTGDPVEKLKQISTLISKQLDQFVYFIHELGSLTESWPSPEELDTYFRDVFKVDGIDASTKSENKIKRLKELFIHGQGNQQKNVRGTWYAAYNAASEYLNYEAGQKIESRISSLWFGVNNITNRAALEYALAQVKS